MPLTSALRLVPPGKPFPQSLRFPVYITGQITSPYLRALLKGRVFLLWRASPLLEISPPPSFLESQGFWRRAIEFFLSNSHLPGEEGSLWIGDGPTPQHHPDKPQPPGSCRAAKLPHLSWYFQSGGSHARPSKGWLCAFSPEVGEWGEVKPERLRNRFQGLGWQWGETWPPVGAPTPQHPGAAP